MPDINVIFFVAYNLLQLAYSMTLGFYSFTSLLTVLVSFCLLVWFVMVSQKKEKKFDKTNLNFILWFTLIFNVTLSLIFYGGLYQTRNIFYYLSVLFLTTAVIITLTYVLNFSKLKNRFIILFLLAILVRLFMLFSSPNPRIDVFDLLKTAGISWWKGQNPYSLTYNAYYAVDYPDHFDYLPMSFLLATPFSSLLSDPRYAFILVDMVVAWLIYKIAKELTINSLKNSPFGIFSLLYLYKPLAPFILEQSWLEPFIFLAFVLFVYLYLKDKLTLSIISLIIFASTKQFVIFLVPFLFQLKKIKVKHILFLISGIFFTTLPFALWSFSDFLRDTVFFPIFRPLRYDGLTVFSFLYSLFGIEKYPLIIFSLLLFLLFGLTFNLSKRNFFYWFLNTTIFYFGFFLLFKEAFCNYFYLISSSLILSWVLFYAKE